MRDSVCIGFPLLPRSIGALNELSTADFTKARDPLALFKLWLEEAGLTEINDPEAMTLATVDADGLPDARMVLCKGADERGIVFYTNIESAKGQELKGQPRAAALFHWKSLRRQVRFRGAISEVSGAESDAYFASRPRGSQIGAWASQQSTAACRRAAISRPRWKLTSGGSDKATCRGRTIGAAIGSIRSRSSSGATALPDCTSASGLPVRGPNRPGTSGSFIPEAERWARPSWRRRSPRPARSCGASWAPMPP